MSKITEKQIDQFVRGYVTALLWTGFNDNDDPLDVNCDSEDIAPSTMVDIKADCQDFIGRNETLLHEYAKRKNTNPAHGSPWDYAGHDFWLTRNGQGAGFWDRGLGELGEALTKASKTYGEISPYVGNDGKIHL